MNYSEKKKFSNIMLDNIIAAYNESMLDVMLEAPFHTNSLDEWD